MKGVGLQRTRIHTVGQLPRILMEVSPRGPSAEGIDLRVAHPGTQGIVVILPLLTEDRVEMRATTRTRVTVQPLLYQLIHMALMAPADQKTLTTQWGLTLTRGLRMEWMTGRVVPALTIRIMRIRPLRPCPAGRQRSLLNQVVGDHSSQSIILRLFRNS